MKRIEANRYQVSSVEAPLSKRLELCQQDPRCGL